MDYETPDGSHFSLQEVCDDGAFAYTSVAAFVDGNAFAGRLDVRIEKVDDADILGCLKPVPAENLYPSLPSSFKVVQKPDPVQHYIKAPSFTYEDSLPGKTLVADCVLREASLYEELLIRHHPNIAQYHGCVVDNGRITRLILDRYECNLVQYADRKKIDGRKATGIFDEVLSAIKHLHGLGRAHNDLNPHNICMAKDGRAIVIDLDACLPFGESLLKGVPADQPISNKDNDWPAIEELDDFLRDAVRAQMPR